MTSWRPLAGWLVDGLGDEPKLPMRCIRCGTVDAEVWWVGYRYDVGNWYWVRQVCDVCQRTSWAVRNRRRRSRHDRARDRRLSRVIEERP